MTKPAPTELLYGRRPVMESLRAGRRAFRRLTIAAGAGPGDSLQSIQTLAQERGIPVDATPRATLDARSQGANHQGVVLEAGPYPYCELEDLPALAAERQEAPFLLLLDLLQDVQNVGTLLRTADAVGVHGIVIQERRAAPITPAVVSASSGAVEHLLVARVTNLVAAMKTLQRLDIWLAGLDRDESSIYYDQADLKGALGLVVGSEGEGLRRLVRETCDFLISLPMRGKIASLNAAVAGSVALYATWQARRIDKTSKQ